MELHLNHNNNQQQDDHLIINDPPNNNQETEANEVNIYKIFSEKKKRKTTQYDDILPSIVKNLEKKDLYNRENSKISSLIRKKYTLLLKQSIKNEERKEKFICKAFFQKITKKIYVKMIGTIFQSIISLIAVILYIVSTYYPEEYETTDKRLLKDINNIKWAELAISIIIIIDYIYSFFTSKSKWKFVLNYLNILDLIILVPTFLNIFSVTSSKSLGFMRIFRIIRIMRIFRLQKILAQNQRKDKDDERSEASRRLISSLLSIVAVVFLSTGVIHFLNYTFPELFSLSNANDDIYECKSGADFIHNELIPFNEGMQMSILCPQGDSYVKKPGNITFDMAFYYMVITISTVGYGDIFPKTTLMRLVVSVLLIISIIVISQLEVKDFLKLNSQYISEFKERKGNKHVILSGFFTKSSLNKFLSEFYHEDHRDKSAHIKIVIIQDEFPNKEIQSILLNPKFDESLHYLKGDIFSDKTLMLAKVQTASAVILKSDQTIDGNLDKNDQYLILACKAISQTTQSPIFVQFNKSQSLLHDWADWNFACSSQQIKMSIIIRNGLISGFSTMVMNLTSSISSNIYSKGFGNTPWILEYMEGAGLEIYIVKPPDDFVETDFKGLVERSYLEHSSLPIGIRKEITNPEDKEIVYYSYYLNPVNYTIKKEDNIIIIADDEEAAYKIFKVHKHRHNKREETHQRQSEQKNTETGHNQLKTEDKMLTIHDEENLMYLKENFRDETAKEKNMFQKDEEEHNETLDIMDMIPIEFTKRKKQFKIWEADQKMLSYLHNHYLVFCREEQLWEFMACFNLYFTELIYFVTDQHPGAKWEIIKSFYKNVICIESSYSDQENLNRLHLNKAKHAYILTYAVEQSSVSDSGILPLVKLIEENYEKCPYTLELADELNVRYLSSKGVEDDNIDEELFTNKTLNPNGGYRDNGNDNKTKKAAKLPVRLWPKYAKSDIFFSSSLDSLMAFSYHNEGSLDIIMKLLGIKSLSEQYNGIDENYQLTMFRYVGRSDLRTEYETIVKYFLLLSPPVIPIAVYRSAHEKSELRNEMPYIVTNPKKDLELNKNDKIICIGKPPVGFFEIMRRCDMDSNEQSDISDNDEDSFNLMPNESSNVLYKQTKKDELDLLNEEQLLERLQNEVNYFKIGIKSFGIDIGEKKTKNYYNEKIEEETEREHHHLKLNSDHSSDDSSENIGKKIINSNNKGKMKWKNKKKKKDEEINEEEGDVEKKLKFSSSEEDSQSKSRSHHSIMILEDNKEVKKDNFLKTQDKFKKKGMIQDNKPFKKMKKTSAVIEPSNEKKDESKIHNNHFNYTNLVMEEAVNIEVFSCLTVSKTTQDDKPKPKPKVDSDSEASKKSININK